MRLKDCIRVLDGFGTSLEAILPKLREGYVTPDADTARSLALENPRAFFLAPSGECFHNVTVTGGKPRAEGPLAIKRELRETQQKLDTLEAELAQAETHAATLGRALAEKTRLPVIHRIGTDQPRRRRRSQVSEARADERCPS